MKERTPEENRERTKARWRQLQAEGRCIRCEERRDCDSVQFCGACLRRSREYARTRFAYQGLRTRKVLA